MKQRRLTSHASTLLSLLLATVLLFFAFRGVDWHELGHILRTARLEYLTLAFVILTFSYFGRGLRWRVLLSAEKFIPPSMIFWVTMVGYLGNSFLPARAGELIRAVMVGRKGAISKSFALATALTERMIDVIALVLISVIAAIFINDMPDWLGAATRVMAVAGSIGLVGLFIAPRSEGLLKTLVKRLPISESLSNRALLLLEKFLMGMRAFQHTQRGLSFIGLTAVIWLLDGLVAIQIARAFDLSLTMPEALLLLAALGLSSAAPSTPGYVGVYQFVAVTVLVPFGFSRNEALGYIISFQAVIYAVVIIWGLVGLRQLNTVPGSRIFQRTLNK